jgi:hypothetical protein
MNIPTNACKDAGLYLGMVLSQTPFEKEDSLFIKMRFALSHKQDPNLTWPDISRDGIVVEGIFLATDDVIEILHLLFEWDGDIKTMESENWAHRIGDRGEVRPNALCISVEKDARDNCTARQFWRHGVSRYRYPATDEALALDQRHGERTRKVIARQKKRNARKQRLCGYE